MKIAKYCSINKLEPDVTTLRALKDIEKQIKLSQILLYISSSIPLVQLFATPGTKPKTLYDISVYDWELFASSLKSISDYNKTRIWSIANFELMSANHDTSNTKFWECVRNATR